jgi:hypothetical protein
VNSFDALRCGVDCKITNLDVRGSSLHELFCLSWLDSFIWIVMDSAVWVPWPGKTTIASTICGLSRAFWVARSV